MRHVRHADAGLAAGFDKDAYAVNGLLGLGFGFVEVGMSCQVLAAMQIHVKAACACIPECLVPAYGA